MLLHRYTLPTTFVAICLVGASMPTRAQERTATIIKDLVGEIAEGMMALDRGLRGWEAETERLEQAAERTYEQWAAAPDFSVQETELRFRHLRALADLNGWDRHQVDQAIETLDGVLSAIERLKGSPQMSDPWGSSRPQFARRLLIVVDRVKERLEDPELIGRLDDLENQIVMRDALYNDQNLAPDQLLKALDGALLEFERVYALLIQVRGVLDAEGVRYAAGARASKRLRRNGHLLSAAAQERLRRIRLRDRCLSFASLPPARRRRIRLRDRCLSFMYQRSPPRSWRPAYPPWLGP